MRKGAEMEARRDMIEKEVCPLLEKDGKEILSIREIAKQLNIEPLTPKYWDLLGAIDHLCPLGIFREKKTDIDKELIKERQTIRMAIGEDPEDPKSKVSYYYRADNEEMLIKTGRLSKNAFKTINFRQIDKPSKNKVMDYI
ncbi:hypothetical protein ACFL1Q_03345 [Patescibacteria group bacterium]